MMNSGTHEVRVIPDIPYRPHTFAQYHDTKHRLDVYQPTATLHHRHEQKNTNNDQKNNNNEHKNNNSDHNNKNPEDTKRRPVLMFVHGGGWKRGDRRFRLGLYQNIGLSFAKHGFVTVVPSYRLSWYSLPRSAVVALVYSILLSALLSLSPLSWSTALAVGSCAFVFGMFVSVVKIRSCGGARHPDHVRDVAAALKWLFEHIEEFNGDVSRVFVMGHSAGGHLVSLLVLDPRHALAEGVTKQQLASLRGVIGVSGVYCPDRFRQGVNCCMGFVQSQMYMAPVFGHDREECAAAFPMSYAVKPPLHTPPFVLLNAASDLGLNHHADAMAEALSAAGVPCEQHTVPSTNHLSIIAAVNSSPRRSCRRRTPKTPLMEDDAAHDAALADDDDDMTYVDPVTTLCLNFIHRVLSS